MTTTTWWSYNWICVTNKIRGILFQNQITPCFHSRRGWVNAVESQPGSGGDGGGHGLNYSRSARGVSGQTRQVMAIHIYEQPCQNMSNSEDLDSPFRHIPCFNSTFFTQLPHQLHLLCPFRKHSFSCLTETTLRSIQPPSSSLSTGDQGGFQHLLRQLAMDSTTKTQWSPRHLTETTADKQSQPSVGTPT